MSKIIRLTYAKQFQVVTQRLLDNIKCAPQKKFDRIKNSIDKFLVSAKITFTNLAEMIAKMNPDLWNN